MGNHAAKESTRTADAPNSQLESAATHSSSSEETVATKELSEESGAYVSLEVEETHPPIATKAESTGRTCSAEGAGTKSQLNLWKEFRSSRAAASASAGPNPKRQKHSLSDPVTVPPVTRTRSRTSVGKANDGAYGELVDIDALRWYAQSGADRLQAQVDDFLAVAEASGRDAGGGAWRIPVSYRRCEATGRRVAATTSAQHVTPECRAASCGSLLCEIDLSSCLPAALTHMADQCRLLAGASQLELPSLKHYLSDREAFLKSITRHYCVGRDAASALVSRLLLGGTICSWRSEVGVDPSAVDIPLVLRFQTEAVEAARLVVQSRPDIVARFPTKDEALAGALSTKKCALAYILGEAEDTVVTLCESVFDRHDIPVSAILYAGFMVDARELPEEQLVAALRVARKEIKAKCGYFVHFERKLRVGASMQARMARLGGSASDIAMAAEKDAEIARLKQRQYEMLSDSVPSSSSRRRAPEAQTAQKVEGSDAPWTKAEEKCFAREWRLLNVADDSFWPTLSLRVGRSVHDCIQYYNLGTPKIGGAQGKTAQNGKIPAERPMPKTDCASRVKFIKEHLKVAAKTPAPRTEGVAECFQQGTLLRRLSSGCLEGIMSAPLDTCVPPVVDTSDSESAPEEPHNVHRYIHSVTRRKYPFRTVGHKSIGVRSEEHATKIRHILRAEDTRARREAEASETDSESAFDVDIY